MRDHIYDKKGQGKETMDIDLSQLDLETLKQVDVREVDLDSLVDIREIKLDQNLPRTQRIVEFIQQVKNPYCFRVGNVAVSVGLDRKSVV